MFKGRACLARLAFDGSGEDREEKGADDTQNQNRKLSIHDMSIIITNAGNPRLAA